MRNIWDITVHPKTRGFAPQSAQTDKNGENGGCHSSKTTVCQKHRLPPWVCTYVLASTVQKTFHLSGVADVSPHRISTVTLTGKARRAGRRRGYISTFGSIHISHMDMDDRRTGQKERHRRSQNHPRQYPPKADGWCSPFQGKTKGQQLKGKIASWFSHFFTLFQTFFPRTFPFKTKGFSWMRTKEKKRS